KYEIDEPEKYNDEQEKRHLLSDIATIEVDKGMLDVLIVKTYKLASEMFMNLLKQANVPISTQANSKSSTIFIAEKPVASVQLSALATNESAVPNVSSPISKVDGLTRLLTPFPSRRQVIISGVALGLAIVGGIVLVEHAYISIPSSQPHITSSQFRSLALG